MIIGAAAGAGIGTDACAFRQVGPETEVSFSIIDHSIGVRPLRPKFAGASTRLSGAQLLLGLPTNVARRAPANTNQCPLPTGTVSASIGGSDSQPARPTGRFHDSHVGHGYFCSVM